ncbi:MAG TPA: AAA family ATPase, partial [Terriglobales bacterium]|nr:AAA family ATPase [Terriglobales bacterium]
MARLMVTLLGGFEAHAAGKPLALPKKTQALIAYLALAPKPACPRTELETLLWGDMGRAQAQQNLRQTLAGLRRVLGRAADDTLHAETATVGLARAAVVVDAVRFEALLRKDDAAAHGEAVALYRGELLAGLDVDEGPFEAWLAAQRERFRELAMHGLAQLLTQQSRGRALDDAAQTASRMLAIDPLHEPAHRALMRLYVRQGRRPAALRQYQTCLNALRQELGVEPAPETKKAYEEILRGATAAPVDPSGGSAARARADARESLTLAAATTPFVGRDAELATLRTAMDDAFAGRARVVALLGEAGVGKSRLLAQAAAEALQRGARVLPARAYRSEQILPLAPWRDALREARILEHPDVRARLTPTQLEELARLVPELGDAPAPAPRADDAARMFDAIIALVDVLLAARPLALTFEDLQWADDTTLRLLAHLQRRQRARPLLVMAAVTEEDLVDAPAVRDLLADLDRERALQRLPVQPLSRDDTVALVRALARRDDTPAVAELAEQVWALSEGNPFMVVETVSAVEEGSATATRSALPLPERVRDVVGARLDRLGEASRGVIAVAAVIGRDVDFPLLQRAAGADEDTVASALEELVRRRVLRVVGERFAFTHNRIREVIYRQLLPPRRKLLHRQAAAALRALPAAALEPSWALLGGHAFEGELWEDAADYFRRAGHWALARSFNREAATCFERAVAALDRSARGDVTALAIDLRLEQRTALVLLGEVERARLPLEQARPLADGLRDPVRLGQVWAQASSQYWWTGQPAAALEAAETAARFAKETGDHSLLVASTICRAYAHQGTGDYRAVTDVLDPVLATMAAPDRDRYGQHQLPIVSPSNQAVLALAHLGEFDAALARQRD